MIHDPEARQSVFFAEVDVTTPVGPLSIEIVMKLSFNEAADNLTRIDEYFDSLAYSAFFTKVMHAQEEGPTGSAPAE